MELALTHRKSEAGVEVVVQLWRGETRDRLIRIVTSTVLVEVVIGIVPPERLLNIAMTIVIIELAALASIITIADRTKVAMRDKVMVEIDTALQVADTPQAGVRNSQIIFSNNSLLLRHMRVVKQALVRPTNLDINKTKEGLNIKTAITT